MPAADTGIGLPGMRKDGGGNAALDVRGQAVELAFAEDLAEEHSVVGRAREAEVLVVEMSGGLETGVADRPEGQGGVEIDKVGVAAG